MCIIQTTAAATHPFVKRGQNVGSTPLGAHSPHVGGPVVPYLYRVNPDSREPKMSSWPPPLGIGDGPRGCHRHQIIVDFTCCIAHLKNIQQMGRCPFMLLGCRRKVQSHSELIDRKVKRPWWSTAQDQCRKSEPEGLRWGTRGRKCGWAMTAMTKSEASDMQLSLFHDIARHAWETNEKAWNI